MRYYKLFLIAFLTGAPLFGQLTAEQRAFDFQSLSALFAKRYAPYDWKKQVYHFDLFDIKPWLARVQAAKDDLEFFEIEAEYVAQLNDLHTGFQMTSDFYAYLGFWVDIYDSKIVIDSINRSLLPANEYRFAVGDELVSLDGVSAEDWMIRIWKYRQRGNATNTARAAVSQITARSQAVFPRAVEIGDTATVEIRRASGALETYTMPWIRSGVPVTAVGPVPMPKTLEPRAIDYRKNLENLHTWKLRDDDILLRTIPWAEDTEEGQPRRYLLGYGSRTPVFRYGFPSNFVQRLGKLSSDFHFSGTYQWDGLRIGYLRIPNFEPSSTYSAVTELETEIKYFNDNTDGLVVDVMRNTGGGCYMFDVAARLIPYPFYFFGEEIRATQDRLNSFQSLLEEAQYYGADQSTIDTYQRYVEAMKAALAANRGMTEPIPACSAYDSMDAPVMENNQPASVVYSKPMIVLTDEFSTSAGDIFPAMIQDNKRALLVGNRTNGAGGSISGWDTGFYSESYSTNTNTLVVRKAPVTSPDLPAARYVENIGAIPDVQLSYMSRENLLNGGQTFVTQFSQVISAHIQAAKGQ